MSLVVTSAPSEELLTVEEAKRHLRLMTNDHDDEIASLIRAARDDCERETGRTFRTAVTRTLKTGCWWGNDLYLPWPPLLGITSITSFDASNVSQTLAVGNYYIEHSTDSKGRIVWTSSASLPGLYDRHDAITVTFTTGYASLSVVPPVAVQAMKTKLTELWGVGTEWEIKAAVDCTKRLLGKIDATSYA